MDFLPVPIQTLLKSKSFATLWTAKPIFLINIAVTLFYEIWFLYVRTLYLEVLTDTASSGVASGGAAGEVEREFAGDVTGSTMGSMLLAPKEDQISRHLSAPSM